MCCGLAGLNKSLLYLVFLYFWGICNSSDCDMSLFAMDVMFLIIFLKNTILLILLSIELKSASGLLGLVFAVLLPLWSLCHVI